jgi:cell division protein ZipA
LAAELRWILLGLSVPLLAAIWWWSARRSAQAPGNPELREPTPPLDPRYANSNDEDMRAQPRPRDWGVPPFEPLSIRTAEFDHEPVFAGPILINADPAPLPELDPPPLLITAQTPAASEIGALPAAAPAAAVPAAESAVLPRPAPPPAPISVNAAALNAAELQRIVTIRVCAVGEVRWSGRQLRAALEQHGLAFGRYQVFHRKHPDGRSLFCVASLVEPGTFDLAEMADQEFRGITLFAVMPGPTAPLETLDELIATARGLAQELSGMVQDNKGMPLSPQRAAAVREDIAHFQASLPVT